MARTILGKRPRKISFHPFGRYILSEENSVRLRAANVEDAEAIQAIYAPHVVSTAISFEEVPPSVDDIEERIEDISRSYPYLVAVESGRLVGFAYASPHRTRAAYRWSVDVTAYVGDGAQGRGVGKMLYRKLLKELEERRFHAAFAGIALPNQKSVALHETMGFTQVGIYRDVGFKFGRWHDVGWWQRILSCTADRD